MEWAIRVLRALLQIGRPSPKGDVLVGLGVRNSLKPKAVNRNYTFRIGAIKLIATGRIVGPAMPSVSRTSKCAFRRIVAPEPISPSELETAERLLARFVALAYAAENPDLFPGGIAEPPGGQTFPASAVPLLAPTVSSTEAAQNE